MTANPIESKVKSTTFKDSAIYRITVIGNLDGSWSARLSGMQITLDSQIDGKNVYLLVGKLKDQAELIGILNTLYDLHLSLIEIKIL